MKEPSRPCAKCGGNDFIVTDYRSTDRTYMFECVGCGQPKFIIQPEGIS